MLNGEIILRKNGGAIVMHFITHDVDDNKEYIVAV